MKFEIENPQAVQAPAIEEAPVTLSSHFDVTNLMPSKMSFYSFDDLALRPYRLPELMKLGAASVSGSMRYVTDAIRACIDKKVPTLALMDLWSMAYWLRLQSYPNTPFSVNWRCSGLEHFKKVALKQLPDASLDNTTVLESSNLSIQPLDVDALAPIAAELHETHGLFLHPPTVSDFLEASETGDDWTPEQVFMSKYASVLNVSHGTKLVDRIEFLTYRDENAADVLGLLSKARDIFQQAGVNEKVNVVCKECGEGQEIDLEASLLTFFPFAN